VRQSSAWIRKKKELIGDFKNPGRTWRRKADPVLVHDWPQDAAGQAIPYGIYELTKNHGYVCIGDCFDTPRFAVEAISDWWWREGRRDFPEAGRLLVLADAGGSNGCRSRVWKAQLQEQLCDAFGLEVTVCHYPTGCSKWNPIEHRLFSSISLNWAGVPLRSFDLIARSERNRHLALQCFGPVPLGKRRAAAAAPFPPSVTGTSSRCWAGHAATEVPPHAACPTPAGGADLDDPLGLRPHPRRPRPPRPSLPPPARGRCIRCPGAPPRR
jgi:Rhodopirellula transposase DDE domain